MAILELIEQFREQLKELEEEVLEAVSNNNDDSCGSHSLKYEIKHIFKERMWQLKLLEIDEAIK